MTLQEIVSEVFEGLGEPSDLQYRDLTDAIDTNLAGWHWLVDAVNGACIELAAWKFTDGRQLRFRLLEQESFLQTFVAQCNISAGTTTSQLLTTDLAVQADNFYQGMVIQYGTERNRVLMSRTNGTDTELFVLALPTVSPIGTAIVSERLYRFMNNTAAAFGTMVYGIGYNPNEGEPLEIVSVYDMTSNSELSQGSKYDPLTAVIPTLSTPSSFYKVTNGLRLDTWPDAERTYIVRYMRTPRRLDYLDLTASPELPIHFHKAIVLHCLWWGYRRMQENNSAYATKNDLVDMLRRLRTEYDLQDEFTNHQITLSNGGN